MAKNEMVVDGKGNSGMVIAVDYYGSAEDGPVVWVSDAKEATARAITLDAGSGSASASVLSIMLSTALVYRWWGIQAGWRPTPQAPALSGVLPSRTRRLPLPRA